MLHLNDVTSSLEHPEVTVRLGFSLLPVCVLSPSLGFQHLCQNPSPITKEWFCSASSGRLISPQGCGTFFLCCWFVLSYFFAVTHFAVLSWRVLVHPTGKGCGRPSHLNARPVKMQHLGSHSLYTAHDLLLMAHQGDSQTHYIPKAETQRS